MGTKTKFLSKLIGDKAFYRMVFAVAVPILLQNVITNFVSLLDNIMVGRIGTEEMSGVSIANILFFVFNLAIFGATSGVGIFTAQYYGSNNETGLKRSSMDRLRFTDFKSPLLWQSCHLCSRL